MSGGVASERWPTGRMRAPALLLRPLAALGRERVVLALTAAGLAAGLALRVAGGPEAARAVWAATILLALVPLTWSVVGSLLRRDLGVDAIALLAMGGALALGEYLAGAVVALMLAGGNAVEDAAGRVAVRELRGLVERAPRRATLVRGEALEDVPVERVAVGDLVLVRPGEVVPVDGEVVSGVAALDESALTGEPLPVTRAPGGSVFSGTVNSGGAFEMRALRTADESTYAGLVRMVEEAQRQKAPFVRMADRYATVFLPVTLAVAGLAWALSGDPVRALAVVVVATPCPLILAAPIALMAGVSRAARAGVVCKGAGVVERLGELRAVVLDKTGTLTLGAPGLEASRPLDGLDPDELLRLAASLDQLSTHPLARALVGEARRRGLALARPDAVVEEPGMGIEGEVEGRRVTVGGPAWLAARGIEPPAEAPRRGAGTSAVLVGVDGRAAGVLLMGDSLRDDAADLVRRLRGAGVRRVVLASGDRPEVAEAVARTVGADAVHALQSPEDKLALVRSLQADPRLGRVAMVGDGVNDAPALAGADVGIALGTLGATVSSETADAVVTVDRVAAVADAVAIGRRSLGIARQSVMGGMALSLALMVVAAFGHLPPVWGAASQEAIDLLVIANALRALR